VVPIRRASPRRRWIRPRFYVATERDNTNNGVSRLSVLRFDTSAAGTDLTATHDWNLTADIPAAGANLGLEAITWVPDSYLLANGFIDESTLAAYDPSRYPGHGTGIFFVGVEATGAIYGYALDHTTGGFQRVATLSSGQISVMDLAFDRDVGQMWAYCDNMCGNRSTILRVGTGRFQIKGFLESRADAGRQQQRRDHLRARAECTGGRKGVLLGRRRQLGRPRAPPRHHHVRTALLKIRQHALRVPRVGEARSLTMVSGSRGRRAGSDR
jgi:hypothetical protein